MKKSQFFMALATTLIAMPTVLNSSTAESEDFAAATANIPLAWKNNGASMLEINNGAGKLQSYAATLFNFANRANNSSGDSIVPEDITAMQNALRNLKSTGPIVIQLLKQYTGFTPPASASNPISSPDISDSSQQLLKTVNSLEDLTSQLDVEIPPSDDYVRTQVMPFFKGYIRQLLRLLPSVTQAFDVYNSSADDSNPYP